MAMAVGPQVNRETSRVQVLRLYGAGTAALLMLVETEWPLIMAGMKVLDNWLGRSMMQGFLAVLTLEIATSRGDSDFDKSLQLYRQVAGYCMLGCATFYALGGVLCFGALKRARYRMQVERLRVERDLEVIERQREELTALLAVYTKE